MWVHYWKISKIIHKSTMKKMYNNYLERHCNFLGGSKCLLRKPSCLMLLVIYLKELVKARNDKISDSNIP